MINPDDIAYSEYAVEVYEKGTDRFYEQIDVLNSEEEARQFIEDAGPISKDYYYGVLQINYDTNGNEISTERL
jgi:hypothetical protein